MQKKKIKRLVFILIGLWLVILATGLIFSHSFQSKIIDALTEQADKHLLAEVHIRKRNIHFSVIKKFPLASIELRNVVIKTPSSLQLETIEPPHADTLLFAKKLFLQMNLKSLLNKKYQLQKIAVTDGFIQILNDKAGNSSLHIIKKSHSENDFQAHINSFSLSNIELITKTASSKFQSLIFVKKGEASGVFTKEDFSIKLTGSGAINKLLSQNESFLTNQLFNVNIAINHSNNSYSISKGAIEISNIPMKVIGNIQTNGDVLVDLVFSANNASLKHIDNSLLHGIIGQSGFVPKSGNLQIQSSIKGYVKKSFPKVNASFTITDGKIVDKNRNISYEEIYLRGTTDNWKNNYRTPSFSLKVDTFHVKTGQSLQYGALTIRNIQDGKIRANTTGFITASDLNKYKNIEGIKLEQGLINNKLFIQGSLPQKKKNQKGNLQVKGNLYLKDVNLSAQKIMDSPLILNGSVKIISNSAYTFDSLLCQTANTDVTINGSLSNVKQRSIALFRGQISSRQFHVNDFIPQKGESTEDKKSIHFPDSIQISGNLKIDNLYFGDFQPANLKGHVYYSDKKLDVNNLNMESFSGKVSGNAQIVQRADAEISLTVNSTIKNANLGELFKSFNNFNQSVISSDHLNGQLSGKIDYSSSWSSQLKIDLASIFAQGQLLLEHGELKNFDPILGLSKFIEVEELKHIRFDNLSTSILIKNQKIILDQTHIASSAITFDGSGIHDFDNKYDYRLQVGLSDILWRKARKKKSDITEFGYVVDDGNDRTTIPFLISGKGSSFDVKYDKRTSRRSFKEKVKEEKAVLKELFQSDQVADSDSEYVEERDAEEEKSVLKKTDSGTYQHKTDEFILEWDDSEEEEDGDN